MKYLSIVKIFAALFVVIQISGCGDSGGGDPAPVTEPTANEAMETKLKAKPSWQIADVKVDGVTSDLYPGLTVSFGSKTFTSTNGGKVWPASGTWNFVGEAGNKISRNDGVEISISTLTDSQLVMSFTWSTTTFNGGRATSLKGSHTMTFR